MFGDDDYSRRQILGAAAGVGAFGLSAGAATRAHLLDRSLFPGNRLQAGELTLDLAGAGVTGSDAVADFPTEDDFESGNTVLVEFPELEPGDEGVFSAAYRLCENPGRVWLRTRLVGAGDTDLEEHLHVRFTGRPDCEDRSPGDRNVQFEGTLGDFHDAFADGKILACGYAGKVEYDDDADEFYIEDDEDGEVTSQDDDSATVEFTTENGDTLVIELTDLERNEDDEIVAFDYAVREGAGLCEVMIAGGTDSDTPGPKRKYYTYDCSGRDSGLTPPDNDNSSDPDDVYGLSHVEFYTCDGCQGCPPACVDLEWTFDEDPPEDLLDDSLRLELELLAVQCRHQSEANNPWR